MAGKWPGLKGLWTSKFVYEFQFTILGLNSLYLSMAHRFWRLKSQSYSLSSQRPECRDFWIFLLTPEIHSLCREVFHVFWSSYFFISSSISMLLFLGFFYFALLLLHFLWKNMESLFSDVSLSSPSYLSFLTLFSTQILIFFSFMGLSYLHLLSSVFCSWSSRRAEAASERLHTDKAQRRTHCDDLRHAR